jgi:hypothetical protein
VQEAQRPRRRQRVDPRADRRDDLDVAVDHQDQAMLDRDAHQGLEHRAVRVAREQVQLAEADPVASRQWLAHALRQLRVVHPRGLVALRRVDTQHRPHALRRVEVQPLRGLGWRARDDDPADARGVEPGDDLGRRQGIGIGGRAVRMRVDHRRRRGKRRHGQHGQPSQSPRRQPRHRRTTAHGLPRRDGFFVAAAAPVSRGGRPVCCVSSVPRRGAVVAVLTGFGAFAGGVEFLRRGLT